MHGSLFVIYRQVGAPIQLEMGDLFSDLVGARSPQLTSTTTPPPLTSRLGQRALRLSVRTGGPASLAMSHRKTDADSAIVARALSTVCSCWVENCALFRLDGDRSTMNAALNGDSARFKRLHLCGP